EFVEAGARELSGLLAGLLFGLQKRLVKLVDLVRFAFRLGAGYAKCPWRGASCDRRRRRACLRRLLGIFLGAFGFDGFRGGTEVPLNFSFFFLLRFLAKDVLVLRVGLREVIQAEALAVLQVAAALGVALNHKLDAPFDFGRRSLAAAAVVLVIFNFELA